MVLFWLNWMLLDHRDKGSERTVYVDAVNKRNKERIGVSRIFEYMLAGAYSDVKVGENPNKEYGIDKYNTNLDAKRKDWDEKVKALRTERMKGALKGTKKPVDTKLKVSASEHRLCYA